MLCNAVGELDLLPFFSSNKKHRRRETSHEKLTQNKKHLEKSTAPWLLMLQVPMNTFGPCRSLVQLTDEIPTTWNTTTENAVFSIYFPGNLQIFVKSYIQRIVSLVEQCQRFLRALTSINLAYQ